MNSLVAPRFATRRYLASVLTLALTCLGQAQQASSQASTNPPPQLPPTTVVARRTPESAETIPVSVTAVTAETIEQADVQLVRDAAIYAPNIYMTEFSARFLSNPRFRGVGSSPNNPGITTSIDGVPQLNANSSSIELVDVEQIEFVRGPQATLFGRNTIGGVINVLSRAPSDALTADAQASYGNYNAVDARFRVSGPLSEAAGVSFAGGYSARDGYSENTVTGDDVDSREAFFGKAQFALKTSESFNVRFLLTAESSDDGDFALADLNSVRANPYQVSRDFEGSVQRNVVAPTILADWRGEAVDVSSISGFVYWQTEAQTDLDYTAMPLMTRDNDEHQSQFTQEIRLSSARDRELRLSEDATFSWQSGIFFFAQDYNQNTETTLSPLVTQLPFSMVDGSDSELQDWGLGGYVQGGLTFWEKLDFTLGARVDYEDKRGDLLTYTDPALTPPVSSDLAANFTEFSPEASLGWRVQTNHLLYVTAGRGYKAGGFNPTAIPGNETYDTEHLWSYEAGVKSSFLDQRLQLGLAVFYLDWDDLQLNVPIIQAPGRFYIANAGSAVSKGVELELRARPFAWCEVSGSAGYVNAEFLSGSQENGASISGNDLPYTPEFTGQLGVQLTWSPCQAAQLYARAEGVVYGDFAYDSSNLAGQDTYSLANFRAGVRGQHWFVEGWVNNAFDTEYAPIALPFSTSFAPSGYIAEPGAPLTFGVRAGLEF